MLPASKRRKSVPAAPLLLDEGTLLQRDIQHSRKKEFWHKEPPWAQLLGEQSSETSLTPNPTLVRDSLSNPLLQCFRSRISKVSRQKYQGLTEPESTYRQVRSAE